MSLFTPAPFSYCLPDGSWLYQRIQLSIEPGLSALLGRNGSGKSTLARQLQQCVGDQCYLLPQLPAANWQQHSVASLPGIDDKLMALQQLAAGVCDADTLARIGGHWQLADDLCQQLQQLGVSPADWPNPTLLSAGQLSGGQLNRLRLWWAFYQQAPLLILDEPSNHLDTIGRQWLSQQIASYLRKPKRAILLISHDRELLAQVSMLYELSATGLTRYGGNYTFYQQQRQLQQTALQQQRQQAERNLAQQQRSAQVAAERAAKRQQQGEKRRGSQASVLLDYQKNRAQSAVSARRTQEQHQLKQAQHQLQAIKTQQEIVKPQQFYLQAPSAGGSKQLVNAEALQLAYGQCAPLTFHWHSQQRIQLQGANGSGKSTLLKTLAGLLSAAGGQLQLNGRPQYLDQHFSLLNTDQSALANLRQYCPALTATDARTLLASVGLRGDNALKPVSVLSGGERMKLAMLQVSQHSDSLLLLDEPDNHLDLDAKQLLAAALFHYPAGFVVVSHDPYFIEQLGIDTVLQLNT